MITSMHSSSRGKWSSKLGFILAATGSAVGLGNIWGFPTKVVANGGAIFVVVYLVCAFLIAYPVLVAELSIGRKTNKNPYGAFKALHDSRYWPLVGFWGIICGVMILAFYNVIAGWAFSFVFEQLFSHFGWSELAAWVGDTENSIKNVLFSMIFMAFTISILYRGISSGIEKCTKTVMPLLILFLMLLIFYSMFQPGFTEGIEHYLSPDLSKINADVVFSAMGQAFFSLSLGMGTMITYGSYLAKKENLPGSAAIITLSDVSIAFLAGLLIIPAMFIAKETGLNIYVDNNPSLGLISGDDFIFTVLPHLFHNIGGILGMLVGTIFFVLLSIAALTSTISLLEVPVSYAIDEHKIPRKKAVLWIGSVSLIVSLIIAINPSLIGIFVLLFNDIGLPIGGTLICIFIGYVWKPKNALKELSIGNPNIYTSKIQFSKIWPILIRYVVPLVIIYNLINTLIGNLINTLI